MKIEQLINELNELKEKGFDEIKGTLFATCKNRISSDTGAVLTAEEDSDWLRQEDVYL